ncbi:hypothetical protein OGM63_09205 [Plectonema radiosum NIES-515]|uniref:Uncharacterized protein n=1 Tax=Plectonema radiosum NIES-515 TaxID=2986073 RepID=A0ABT3AX39_9CYAN|nr:hypothetical protein [Plectonema radiosum]MCV3213687.1 hypothetical protein [Plectonema radiosum NIES-515]
MLIRIVTTPHQHDEPSKCYAEWRVPSGECHKAEEGDVAFIRAIAGVRKWW